MLLNLVQLATAVAVEVIVWSEVEECDMGEGGRVWRGREGVGRWEHVAGLSGTLVDGRREEHTN